MQKIEKDFNKFPGQMDTFRDVKNPLTAKKI